jgi:hypothetical protein
MKTVKELVAERFEGPDSLKRRAQGLRRLCGGVRAEAERKNDTGLTDKELRTLNEAADILSTLAVRYDGAKKEKQKLLDATKAMEVKVREAMKGNFDQLKSIPDQVALIAASAEYQLRDDRIRTLADLRDAVKENIDYLARRWAEQSMSRAPTEVVSEAWAKFENLRAGLQSKHAAVIGKLTIAAQSDQ